MPPNLQLSSETLRLVPFILRLLMSTQRQGATRTVEERLRKRSGASCEADGAFHSLTGRLQRAGLNGSSFNGQPISPAKSASDAPTAASPPQRVASHLAPT